MPKTRTDKQRKLLKLISANLGREKPMTMLEMMLAAGYEESTARQQSTILVGIREELDPIVKAMEKHREAVVKQMVKKLPKAKYRDLTDSLDKLTKNIQLLSGKATDRHDNRVVSWNYIVPANASPHPDNQAGA